MSATDGPTIDFFGFWSVPQVLHHEAVKNIYSAEDQREMSSRALLAAEAPGASDQQRLAIKITRELYGGRIDATGSPLLYTLIGVASSGDFRTDQKRFLFICMVCLAASILFLKRLLRFNVLAASLLLVFILENYAPFTRDIKSGNVNEFQLLAIVLFIFFTARSRPLLAGLILGTSTAFKPTTLMVLALSVIAGLADREYEELLYLLLGYIAALASCVIAAAAYFHKPAIWLQFLNSLPKTLSGNETYVFDQGNFSLSALAYGRTTLWSAAIPLILLSTFFCLFFGTRRGKLRSTELPHELNADLRLDTAFCVGGCGYAVTLLSSPLAWVHYYLLLLPLCLYLLFSEADRDHSAWGIARRTVAVSLPFLPLAGFSLSLVQIVKYSRLEGILTIAATILTLILASYRIFERRRLLQLRDAMPCPK